MKKEIFEELGITNKNIREFTEAIDLLAKNKKPTENFAKVDPTIKLIQEIAKKTECKIEVEYMATSVSIILKFDTVGFFNGECKDLLCKAIDQVDTVIIEDDDIEEDVITVMFILKNIFKL